MPNGAEGAPVPSVVDDATVGAPSESPIREQLRFRRRYPHPPLTIHAKNASRRDIRGHVRAVPCVIGARVCPPLGERSRATIGLDPATCRLSQDPSLPAPTRFRVSLPQGGIHNGPRHCCASPFARRCRSASCRSDAEALARESRWIDESNEVMPAHRSKQFIHALAVGHGNSPVGVSRALQHP